MSNNEVKYPEIEVELSGSDGNAFAVIGKVANALRRKGVSTADRAAFQKEATSGDYDNVLATCMKWVTVS